MTKAYLLIPLDTGLVNQIKAALPDTGFNTVEAAIADVIADGITGSHSAWTKRISWEPSESEEEPSPADRYEIGHIQRAIAAKINPIISTTCSEDTLGNCSELCEAIGEMVSEDHAFSRDDDYRYLLGYAVAAALKYEGAFSALRRKQL